MTAWLLNNIPGPILALIIIGLCIGYAFVVTSLGRRLVAQRHQRGHNEVGGMILATVGVIYAVLLAFAVIALWQRRELVEEYANEEATHLIAAYRDAGGLPSPARESIQAAVVAYAQDVIDDGYVALRNGVASTQARAGIRQMYVVAQGIEPQGAVQQAWYAALLTEINQVSVARAHRVFAVSGSLPPIFWAVLIVTTMLTLALGALIAMDDAQFHNIFMVLFAACIGSLLFLALILDRPFSGDYALQPEPFRSAIEGMTQ